MFRQAGLQLAFACIRSLGDAAMPYIFMKKAQGISCQTSLLRTENLVLWPMRELAEILKARQREQQPGHWRHALVSRVARASRPERPQAQASPGKKIWREG